MPLSLSQHLIIVGVYRSASTSLCTYSKVVYTSVMLLARVHLSAAGLAETGPAASEVHDVHCRLMPPVKHHNHQYMPQLVAGANVVHLTWR